jgi:protoporphyrinogen IX oxidase
MTYSLLKFVHVASIAVWFGGLVMMFVLNRLLIAAGETAAAQALGRQAQRVGVRIFMPAVVLTLITGIGMVQVAQYGFGRVWIIWGIAGLIASMIIGGALTGGTARKLGARMASGDIDAAGIAAAQKRIVLYALLNITLLLSIIWAMVAKP